MTYTRFHPTKLQEWMPLLFELLFMLFQSQIKLKKTLAEKLLLSLLGNVQLKSLNSNQAKIFIPSNFAPYQKNYLVSIYELIWRNSCYICSK